MSERRGHHKIFVGMAAGVGKTFRMLQEGQAELEDGRDVVVGFLETHGRADTAALAEGLEVLARRRVSYRATRLEEMDLRGILVGSSARWAAVPRAVAWIWSKDSLRCSLVSWLPIGGTPVLGRSSAAIWGTGNRGRRNCELPTRSWHLDEPIRALTTALRVDSRSEGSGDVVLAPGPRVEGIVMRKLACDRRVRAARHADRHRITPTPPPSEYPTGGDQRDARPGSCTRAGSAGPCAVTL